MGPVQTKSEWEAVCLERSDVYIITFKRSNDVRALSGGSIFILGACKAKGLAESTTDSELIGDGLYWTYETGEVHTRLVLNAPDESVIGQIYLYAHDEDGGVEILYVDRNGDETTEFHNGALLRDRLSELASALTCVPA